MESSKKNIKNLDLAFEGLFDNQEVDYDIEAKIMASKILSEISTITEKNGMTRKEVAEQIGTSASYLTQLYRGSKTLNLVTLAKLKDKLNLDVDVKVSEKRKDSDKDLNRSTLKKAK